MNLTKTEVAEILEQAAEHVRTGWTRGTMFGDFVDYATGTREVCGLGGVALACNLNPRLMTVYTALLSEQDPRAKRYAATVNYLTSRQASGEGVGFTANWNDAHGRTQQEVVDRFLEIAKDLRNEAEPEETA